MSGIEIVGLLLGSVPLVISALEHYKEGIDVISDFRNYRSTLKSLKTKLSIQEELYRGTLKLLLLPELSLVEVHALFPEPGSEGSCALWELKTLKTSYAESLVLSSAFSWMSLQMFVNFLSYVYFALTRDFR